MRLVHVLLMLFGLQWGASLVAAADTTDCSKAFATTLTVSDLDSNAYAEWGNGKESAFVPTHKWDVINMPEGLCWTTKGAPDWRGRSFGAAQFPGARHLRVGFVSEQRVGTVLIAGNVSVSVLKPGGAYPGDMGDDSQWIEGRRLINGLAGSTQQESKLHIAAWVFPAGTETRALRFTHVAGDTDRDFSGVVKGIYLLVNRYANLAPLAQVSSRKGSDKIDQVIDGRNGFWNSWTNMDEDRSLRKKPASQLKVAPDALKDSPECIVLTWPVPVDLQGLVFICPGFDSADIQVYRGPGNVHPRDARDSDWETVKRVSDLRDYYPRVLGLNPVSFAVPIKARAVRIRIDKPALKLHRNEIWKTSRGKRVWLGEVQALHYLGDRELDTATLCSQGLDSTEGGIAIKLNMPEDGYLTMVIEDEKGIRVRNLVSETFYRKGETTIWWDGSNDLGRDADAAWHGLYKIPTQLVSPGTYKVRGLWRKKISKVYEFGVYNEGNPPWNTDDHTGAWLSNHSAPSSALFVPAAQSPTGEPAMFLGCYITEGPDGVGWFDLDGRKRGGRKWLGGIWTAAPYLARDVGSDRIVSDYCYAASVWLGDRKTGKLELRVNAIGREQDRTVAQMGLEAFGKPFQIHIGGIAARNKLLACSMTMLNQVFLLDAESGKLTGKLNVASPKGIAFDRDGKLLVLSGNKLLRITPKKPSAQAAVIIAKGLDEPAGLTLDGAGNIYVSNHGKSHQVKVFTADGNYVRSIGSAGSPRPGPYEPQHMHFPVGMSIDSRNHLWVAEHDYMPKRVSVWTLDGKLVKAFYGPAKYGGGGTIDSADKTRFYYADSSGTMEFKLDWEEGSWQLLNILARRDSASFELPQSNAYPETALYPKAMDNKGGKTQRYFTNCYNSKPTSGASAAFVFAVRNDGLRPVAGMGNGMTWKSLFQKDEYRALVPDGVDINGSKLRNHFFFIWSDSDDDGMPDPDEFEIHKAIAGGVTVLPDLSFCIAHLGQERDDYAAVRFRPTGFTKTGVPRYRFSQRDLLAKGVKHPASSGGDQVLADDSGNAAIALGVAPFDKLSVCGTRNGVASWSYPNLWPGLHASHHAAKPEFPGELLGTTRLMGGLFTAEGSDAGPLWALNGNMGNFFVFTLDGLFVATVFEDCRVGKRWKMSVARRGMDLDGIALGNENFWPTISRTSDGNIYTVTGDPTCIVRLDGFDTIRRIDPIPLSVTAEDLRRAQEVMMAREVARKKKEGSGVLRVPVNGFVPKLDGRVDEWPSCWVEISRAGEGANFNSAAKPYNLQGAVAVAGDKLFAAWKTADRKLLRNSGEMPVAPFKTGGCLDLMIGTLAPADSKHKSAEKGDIRLTITQVKGKTFAVLYRPVAPGTKTPKVTFSSPWRTFEFDRVDDVSDRVQLAADGKGNFEISVPLDVLGLRPREGSRIRGDIGVLRGDGTQTVARTYWSNKATGIVADVPEEAKLSPALWGIWEFVRK